MHASSYTATARVPVGVYLQGRVLVFPALAINAYAMLYYTRTRKAPAAQNGAGVQEDTMAKNIKEATVAPEEDLFAGLTETATSSMTVWNQQLQTALDKETAVRFAEGKRSKALEAVYTWAGTQQLNPIIRYVLIMGLKTLNRKVGK